MRGRAFILFFLLGFAPGRGEPAGASSGRTLTFEERVAAQEAI
jgi:hypothetical protein